MTTCKKHTLKFHLDCDKCIIMIHESRFVNNTSWTNANSFDDVVRFMNKKTIPTVATRCDP